MGGGMGSAVLCSSLSLPEAFPFLCRSAAGGGVWVGDLLPFSFSSLLFPLATSRSLASRFGAPLSGAVGVAARRFPVPVWPQGSRGRPPASFARGGSGWGGGGERGCRVSLSPLCSCTARRVVGARYFNDWREGPGFLAGDAVRIRKRHTTTDDYLVGLSGRGQST